MSVNNLNVVKSSPTNIGFWEIGGYKPNVQRIRDGYEQFEEVTKLLKERVDLEDKYGRSLQSWDQKWKNYVERNLPDGTIKTSLDGVLAEGKELARIHLAVKDRLNDEVVKTIGAFREGSYHRSAIRGLKEQKDIEDKFEKAQHRWKKLWKKLDVAKKHYHSCCRAEKSAYIQMVNSQADLSTISESSEKSRDRHEKCREETRKARLAYEQQLKDISYENTAYVDKMGCVFEECQQFEFTRQKFLLEMISGIQKVLVDLIAPPKLQQIHTNLEIKFKLLGDSQLKDDLKKWSSFCGTDVPHRMPFFEKYTPEFHNISTKSTEPAQHGGVILTKKKLLKSESDFDQHNSEYDGVDYDSLHNKQHQQYYHGSMDNISSALPLPPNNTSNESGSAMRPFSGVSMSTQDVYRAGLGIGSFSSHRIDSAGFKPGMEVNVGANTGNKIDGMSKFYVDNDHMRLSSFDDNTATNSEAASVPTSIDNDMVVKQSQYSETLISNTGSFASAKSSSAQTANDPFVDPFPMPTPYKAPMTRPANIINHPNQPPPYHVYAAGKFKTKETSVQRQKVPPSSKVSTLESVSSHTEKLAVDVTGNAVANTANNDCRSIHEKKLFEIQGNVSKSISHENVAYPLKTSVELHINKRTDHQQHSGSSSVSSVVSTDAAKENQHPKPQHQSLLSSTAVPSVVVKKTENISESNSIINNGKYNTNISSTTVASCGNDNSGYGDFCGEKVRVLYDYAPNESDEIALVKGELVEMFRSADEMGWCYGRKNEKIGFFPAGYVAKLQ